MELEIEDKIQEIYKNLIIEVNSKDFRLNEIYNKIRVSKAYNTKAKLNINTKRA